MRHEWFANGVMLGYRYDNSPLIWPDGTPAPLDVSHPYSQTARPGARVIFRTAAEPSLLPGRIEPAVLDRWRYEETLSRALARRDRSAIYGGFHLYVLEG
jgi:S-adenosylmethionine:diacylglycerol 3-amino-3-carboxypropyl transferase